GDRFCIPSSFTPPRSSLSCRVPVAGNAKPSSNGFPSPIEWLPLPGLESARKGRLLTRPCGQKPSVGPLDNRRKTHPAFGGYRWSSRERRNNVRRNRNDSSDLAHHRAAR